MTDRVIVPEILDSLDADDPAARRSRRDLRLLDFFLGNSRWILRELRSLPNSGGPLAELGAGEGSLCHRIALALPGRTVTGLDIAPRPGQLDARVHWLRGDFFQTMGEIEATTIIGSLILHHFNAAQLAKLGERLRRARQLIFSEPWRDRIPLAGGLLASPLFGRVTRHDMPVSIRAGFRSGEIAAALGLEAPEWTIRERILQRGVVRIVAVRG